MNEKKKKHRFSSRRRENNGLSRRRDVVVVVDAISRLNVHGLGHKPWITITPREESWNNENGKIKKTIVK